MGFPISPHLLRQMSFHIDNYSEATSSPAGRDFASSTCLSVANLKIAKLRLSVNFPKTMLTIQNYFGYEAVSQERTNYKF